MIRKASQAVLSMAMVLLLTAVGSADLLYVSDQQGNLSTFNTTTFATNHIGQELNFPLSTEIEYGNGQLYSDESNGSTSLHTINPSTGLSTGSVVHGPAAFNGMEFVGNTLYVTNTAFSMGPSTLEIVNPNTGAQTVVGATGFGPISGLAYDTNANTMWGVLGGGGLGTLATINLANGIATLGPVLVDPSGNAITHVGSIEFHNGVLYGGTGLNSNVFPGQIFSINTATGGTTFLGPVAGPQGSFLQGITGITTIPEPTSAFLFGVAACGLLLSRRKRN